jgi:hypothetical protein
VDWWLVLVMIAVAGFFLWRSSKDKERAAAATERLTKDNRLYQHIKAGMREYEWRRNQDFKAFLEHKDGQLVFETAHTAAYHVDHFAESRVGFYFKDIEEYGLYGFFAGNSNEYHESYYRTDSTLKTEGRLLHDE